MNKFTKLLSVFVIAGAVGAGVAGLTGCGSTPATHTHNGTLHEAVAATCTQDGTIAYYTCDGADCAGKYFEDEACTKEITNIISPATGHTEKYTDKGDGTHGITCEKGDLAETTAAHVDEDHDGKCDDCEATVEGTYVAEVAATCELEGKKAHYIKGDGSDGKFYSDVNCKTEVTAESLVIAKLPHAYTHTPNETYAKHTTVCTECGDTDKADCVDENSDGKCDVCGGDLTFLTKTAIPAGSYYNSVYDYDLIIANDGTVSFSPNGYSADNVQLSAFAIDTVTGLPTATLSYELYGYSYTKKVEITRSGFVVDGALMPLMPAVIVEDKEAFEGVYSGELTYKDGDNTYKVTEFAITADGKIVYTQVITDKEGNSTSLTQLLNGSYYDVKYNDFKINSRHFVAVEVDETTDMVTKIELTDEGVTATFTYKSGYNGEGFEIPTLPVEDYTIYKDTAGTNSLVIKNYSTSPNYSITFNGNDVTILKGNATDGYVGYVYYYDSAAEKTVEKNYVLKFNADSTQVEVFEADGTTKVATLAPSAVEYPTIKVDGTANNNAVVDPFNSYYAYYKIETAGWYKITAGANDITIYTEVSNHSVTTWGATVYDISSGKSKAIELTAGQYIAVYVDYVTYGFTATYSATEPEPDYEAVTGGKYEIASFNGSNTYFVKGTAAAAGKYYVTVDTSALFDNNDRGAYFEIGGTKYGYEYADSWSVTAAGLTYEATLAEGDEVKVKVGCDNAYLLNGYYVVVYFETEAEHTARLAAEATAPTFSGDQLGDYKSGSDVYTVAADAISLNGDAFTFVANKLGAYYYSLNGAIYAITFEEDGTLSILTANSYGTPDTAIKAVALSFSDAEQGSYKCSFENMWGNTTTVIYTVGADSVKRGSATLTCTSAKDGVYTFVDSYDSTISISFDNDGNMVVTDEFYGLTDAVVSKLPTANFSETEQGTYTYSYEDDWYGTITITFTITANSVTMDNGLGYGSEVLTYFGCTEGVHTLYSSGDTITFSFNEAGNMAVATDGMNYYAGAPYVAVKKTSSGDEEGGEEEATGAVVGENTVQAGMAGYVEVTFSVPGTYTLSYDSSADNVMGIFVGTSMVANGGKFTVTDSVTITVYANDNSQTSKFTIEVAEEESGSSEAFEGFTADQQGTYSLTSPYSGTYVIGANTISTTSYGVDLVYEFVSLNEGVYVFSEYVEGEDGGTFTLTFSFDNDGTMVIESDTWNYYSDVTATKA
ncbi:MAG: hypothetical protein ACI4MQ_02195 [Candidatus Coproplasma sp.]